MCWGLRKVETKGIEFDFVFGVRQVSRSGDLWQMIDGGPGEVLQSRECRLST